MTWSEPACRQILVLVIGQRPLDPAWEQNTINWLSGPASFKRVIPALASGLSHAATFPVNAFPTLGKQIVSAWGGSGSRLAQEILAAALMDERPGVFISYAQIDGTDAADLIAEALHKDGHRVFLDRISGTVGRAFPRELLEAMSTHDLVLVLETPSLRHSKWTKWECAFAWAHHLGPAAIHFTGGQTVAKAVRRLPLPVAPTAVRQSDVDAVIDRVRTWRADLAVWRRAYYETLVRRAAATKSGNVRSGPEGTLSVVDQHASERAAVLVSGVPGRLRHVRRLHLASAPIRILAGDHSHLQSGDAADLCWLSKLTKIDLVGKPAIYSKVRAVL